MSNNGWSNQNQTRVVVVETGAYSGLFFYSPTIGAGNLVGSWTAAAGTDPYGNTYPAGFMIQNGASRVTINSVLGIITESFVTGNPHVDFSAFIQAGAPGIGIAQVDQWLISSAQNSTYGDTAGVVVQSNNSENTNPAQAYLYWESAVGGQNNYVTVSAAGGVISAGNVTGVQPGTGTSLTNPAVAETWHAVSGLLTAGWTVTGATNPARFRYEAQGCIRIDGEVLTTGAGPWPANTDIFSLPAHYPPAEAHPFVTRSDIAVTAGQATVNVLTSGGVQNGQVFTASGQRLWFDGVVFPIT